MTNVLATEWGVSYTSTSGVAGVVLNVHKLVDEPNRFGGVGVVVNHPKFDGLKFDTTELATEFARSVALLKTFVPSREHGDLFEAVTCIMFDPSTGE